MRIGLFGRGRFGSALLASARDAEDLEIAWAVDRGESPSSPVEVAIEASAADAVAGHLDWALATGSSLVIGTTGWEIPDLDARVRGRIGVLAASNFSLAVALMARFAEVLGRYAQLEEDRDLHVLEHHHRLKADAPSGTARLLADALLRGCPRMTGWTSGVPRPGQLGIGVIRAGAEPGRHTVGLDSPSETLEITHRARSRRPFAEGALAAARWLRGRKGLFTMEDLAADLLDPLLHPGAEP